MKISTHLSDEPEILIEVSNNKLEREIHPCFKNNDQLIGHTAILEKVQREKFGALANAIEPFADYVILINEFRLLSKKKKV